MFLVVLNKFFLGTRYFDHTQGSSIGQSSNSFSAISFNFFITIPFPYFSFGCISRKFGLWSDALDKNYPIHLWSESLSTPCPLTKESSSNPLYWYSFQLLNVLCWQNKAESSSKHWAILPIQWDLAQTDLKGILTLFYHPNPLSSQM